MDAGASNLGRFVAGFTPPPRPNAPVLQGKFARLERFEAAHAADLFDAYIGHDSLWD